MFWILQHLLTGLVNYQMTSYLAWQLHYCQAVKKVKSFRKPEVNVLKIKQAFQQKGESSGHNLAIVIFLT